MSTKTTLTQDTLIELLDKNDRAVARAVIAIYKKQTADEKTSHETKHVNNVGFNSADARILTYRAQWLLRTNNVLSGNHLEDSRKRIKKYWKQLLSIANEQAV